MADDESRKHENAAWLTAGALVVTAIIGGGFLIWRGYVDRGTQATVAAMPINATATAQAGLTLTPAVVTMLGPVASEEALAGIGPCVTVSAYYEALNAGKYLEAWGMLTENYHWTENPTGINAFAAYWHDTPVQVIELRRKGLNLGDFVMCQVRLLYVKESQQRYFENSLVLDSGSEEWLIDTAKVMEAWTPLE